MKRSPQSGIACKTCRRRGRKCDRTLPQCTSCQSRGAQCEGYALRWVGLAARGNLACQTFKKTSVDRPSPAGQLSANLAATCLGPRPECSPSRSRVPPPHDIQLINAVFCHPDSVDIFIKYYAREISTAFYLGHDTPETPCTVYILPMARNVLCVRYAVAATASSHMGNRLQDNKLIAQSLHMRLKATEALRQQLAEDTEGADISSLACIVLLAQLDLCSGDCLEFTTHLSAANAIIQRRGSDGTSRAFFEQRLAWLDIMCSTTSNEGSHLSRGNVETALNRFMNPRGRDWGFDVFECPVDLFKYLADVVNLHRLQRSSIIFTDEICKAARVLRNDIRIWNQTGVQPGDKADIIELWRNGILLYLGRTLMHCDETFDTPGILNDVFQRATRLSKRKPRKFATSWPLFQAGLSLNRNENQRKQWLRDEFMTQFRTLGCCNPRLAVEVLDRVWDTGDHTFVNSQRLLF